MSTPKGRKSPKHERVTRATAAATAAAAASKAPAQMATTAASKAPAQMATTAASKAPAQMATAAASKAPAPAATAPKALEEMASIAPEQTASKAKEEDSNDNSRVDRLKTDIKVLQCTDNILIREINELKKLITILFRQVKVLTFQQSSSSRPGPLKPLLRLIKAPEPEPSAHNFKGLIKKGLTSELIKKALSFLKSARLKGISNYKQWYQALRLIFKVYNLEGLFNDMNGLNT